MSVVLPPQHGMSHIRELPVLERDQVPEPAVVTLPPRWPVQPHREASTVTQTPEPSMRPGHRYSQRTLYGEGVWSINLIPGFVAAVPIRISSACLLTGISATVVSAAGIIAALGLYANGPTNQPMSLLVSGAVFPSTTGLKTAPISLAIDGPCVVWGALNCDSNSTYWEASTGQMPRDFGGGGPSNPACLVIGDAGSVTLPASFPGPIGYWDGGVPIKSPVISVLVG